MIGRRRVTVDGDSLLLLTARPPRILRMSLVHMTTSVLVPCGATPNSVAVDVDHGQIFWTNAGEPDGPACGFIERMNLDGGNRAEIVGRGNALNPKQMLVDAQNGYLYWADQTGMRLSRARLDGGDVALLVQTGDASTDRQELARHCIGIAVDPTHRHLYWTQRTAEGGPGRIMRVGLDLPAGADPRARDDVEILLDGIPEPLDLKWDDAKGFLYWTDRARGPATGSFNRARYQNGRLVEPEIVVSGLREAACMALDQRRGRAFVGDHTGMVRLVDLDRPGETRIIFSGAGPLTGMAFLPGQACSRIAAAGALP